jgi:hypothetical protein
MPELSFKLNIDEKTEMYQWLFEMGCTFVLDGKYKETKFIKFNRIEEMIYSNMLNESFLILHKDFQILPLEFSNIVNNPYIGNFYYIQPRIGGPSIDISSFGYEENNIQIEIFPDNVHHYPDYWTIDSTLNYKVPEELKSLYKEIEKYIKKRSKKIRLLLKDGKSYRNFFISKTFFEEAKMKNKKLILWEQELDILGINT